MAEELVRSRVKTSSTQLCLLLSLLLFLPHLWDETETED